MIQSRKVRGMKCTVISGTVGLIVVFLLTSFDFLAENNVVEPELVIQSRVQHLKRTCEELAGFSAAAPATFGSEVVYLRGERATAAVCIPHKVGSHAWGKFAAKFNANRTNTVDDFLKLDFKDRALNSVRVVVVRHPLERLVSVFRMIFEDWCDKKRWLAKQWDNVCQDETFEDVEQPGFIQNKKLSTTEFLKGMLNEHKFGNDKYIARIWKKYHPGQKLTKDNLKFSFAQFVRFIVNGTQDFAGDPYILKHKGLSYHWTPYWQECSLCSDLTTPHVIIHLDTLQDDLKVLLNILELDDTLASEFPHTHLHYKGGLSSDVDLLKKYYSTLTKQQVLELFEAYKLDHQLFGYSPDQFVEFTQ